MVPQRRSTNRLRVPFLKLAKQQKFVEITAALIDEGIRRSSLISWLYDFQSQKESALNQMSPLHLVCMYRPPVHLVELLIQKLIDIEPDVCPEDAIDGSGRTPLHVAAAASCDVSVVRRLLQGTTEIMPAFAKDSGQRFALHWACTNPQGFLKTVRPSRNSITSRQLSIENMVYVITTLVFANPQASYIKDAIGCTPLDLAKENNADRRIINVLEHASKQTCPWNIPKTTATNATESEASSREGLPCEVVSLEMRTSQDDLSSVGSDGVDDTVDTPKKSKQSRKLTTI